MTREIAAFWHVGLTVGDIELSIAFYRDVVGMVESQSVTSADKQLATLVGIPNARVETLFLTSGSFTLQLIQYFNGGGPTLKLGHNHIGSPHLSFFVDDIETRHAAIKARRDIAIISPIVTNQRRTIISFYVADPDGTPVEFVERLTE